MDLSELTPLEPTDAASAQAIFERLCALARLHGVALRATPPPPQHCCGRGCNGCVWEGFMTAARYWIDDAIEALQSPLSSTPYNHRPN